MGKTFTGQTMMQLSLTELSSGGKTYKLTNSFTDILGPKQAAVATERGAVGGAIGAGVGFIGGVFGHHKKAGTAIGAGGGAAIGVATTKTEPAKAKPEQLLHFKLMKRNQCDRVANDGSMAGALREALRLYELTGREF